MLHQRQILGQLIGLGLLLSMTSSFPATAATSAEMSAHTVQFRRIDQPLALKFGVTLGGVALISLELWWFVLSKNKALQTKDNQDAD